MAGQIEKTTFFESRYYLVSDMLPLGLPSYFSKMGEVNDRYERFSVSSRSCRKASGYIWWYRAYKARDPDGAQHDKAFEKRISTGMKCWRRHPACCENHVGTLDVSVEKLVRLLLPIYWRSNAKWLLSKKNHWVTHFPVESNPQSISSPSPLLHYDGPHCTVSRFLYSVSIWFWFQV